MVNFQTNLIVSIGILLVIASSSEGFFFPSLFSNNRPPPREKLEYGECAWYGNTKEYDYGQIEMTASGEEFNPNDLTAAHRTYPFNSYVAVTNTDTGRSVVVRIVDRGPNVDGRILSLSPAAFGQVADLEDGVFPCTSEPN